MVGVRADAHRDRLHAQRLEALLASCAPGRPGSTAPSRRRRGCRAGRSGAWRRRRRPRSPAPSRRRPPTARAAADRWQPITTALASPRRMASIASFRQTPKVEQAATGAKARPVMCPIIEICEAGVLWMFHTTLADTECQGGSGALHFFCSCAFRARFSLMTLSLPDSTSPCTLSASISAQLAQVLLQLRRLPGPVVPPGLLGLVPLQLFHRLRGRRHAGPGLARLLPLAQRRVALGRPEAVPPPLRAVQLQGDVMDRRQIAQAGAHVDMGTGAERLQLLLEARVLPQRLDEGGRWRTGSAGPSSPRAGGSGLGGSGRSSRGL